MMLVIPAIDIRGGQCVRLTQGDYARQTVYGEAPARVAGVFEEQGARMLHVVDLDGAKSGAPENILALQAILRSVSIPVEFGGGVRSLETAEILLGFGVTRVVIGTKLVSDRDLACQLFETLGEKVVAGIDVRDGKVAVEAWTETADIDAFDFAAELRDLGARRIIATDISRDGALAGPNLPFYQRMISAVDIPVIASGGAASRDDLRALSEIGVEGAIVGKALYEGRLSLADTVWERG